MTIAIDVLLAMAVLAAWLGAVGLFATQDPLDRLHSASYVAMTSSFFVSAAILVANPLSQSGLKTVLTFFVLVIPGAVTTHAIGRAVHTRRESRDVR